MKQLFILLAAVCVSCISLAQQKVDDRDLLELKSRMEGFFTIEAQAHTDTHYYHTCLNISSIWQRSEDGFWLYVEQAQASSLNTPYRQRIYHLYRQDDLALISKVYELNEPLRFAGAHNNPELLLGLTKDSLIEEQGCHIYFRKQTNGDFSGATAGKECKGIQPGAAYATSELIVEENKLISWDRGWDRGGKQVWGADKAGCLYIKKME